MSTIHDVVSKHFPGAAVFPLGLTSKFPAAAAKGWNNQPGDEFYYDCFQTLPETLTSQKGRVMPLTGYGVNLRASGLLVVDLDVNHLRRDGGSADGLASWSKLTADMGVELPRSLTVNTMSGGMHVWLKAPGGEDLPTLIGKLGDGIDIKASGMCVGPLTFAKKWNDKNEVVAEGFYEIASDHPIAPAPDWLVTLVRQAHAVSRPTGEAMFVPDVGEFPDHYARKALESAFYVVASAPRGERSDTLNREAYGAAKAGAPISKVVEDLTRAALTYGDWPENDLRRTILRAANDGTGRYVPRTPQQKPVHGDKQPAVAQLKSDGGGGDSDGTGPGSLTSLDDYTDDMDMTDMGMAIRFLREVDGKYCFVPKLMGWRQYAAGAWLVLEEGESLLTKRLMEWCLEEHERIAAEIKTRDAANQAKTPPDPDWKHIKKALEQSLSTLKSSRKVASIWTLVLKHITVGEGRFDAQRRFRCMKNGVFDLATGDLLPHSPTYYFTKQMAGNYTHEDHHALIDLVLEALPTREKREALAFFFGAGLNSYRLSHKKIFNLVGDPDAGKTKIQDLTRAAVGGYADKINTDALVAENESANRFALSTFHKLELAMGAEPSSWFLDPNKVKELTGEAVTKVQVKHAGDMDMELMSTIFISTNGALRMSLHDQQVMFRIVPVIFPFKFTNDKDSLDDPNRRVPDARVDEAVESQEVLNVWASVLVRHAAAWYQAGASGRDALEARYLEVFENDREEYAEKTDRMARALDELFYLGDHGCFMTRADVKDALADWWTEEFGGKNNPSKDKLFEVLLTHPRARKAGVTFEKHSWVKKHLKQDRYRRTDYRGEDITRKAVSMGDLVVGLRLKTDADRQLESGKFAHVAAAQAQVDELKALLEEAERILKEQREESELAAVMVLEGAPIPNDASSLSDADAVNSLDDDFDLDEEMGFADLEDEEVDF